MRSEEEAQRAIEKYADTVRRICFLHLRNVHDVEDVFQEVFLKYILHDASFESEEHEKAWLIRVAINASKDILKSFFRKKTVPLDELLEKPAAIQERHQDVLEAVLHLPEKYRAVVYLFYYEGYSALEIASILKKKENTVYTWLSRARAQLKEELGGDFFEG